MSQTFQEFSAPMNNISTLNFTFDLYGLISAYDNSTYGALYTIDTDDLYFHDNIGTGIGSMLIDVNLPGSGRGTYFSSFNSTWRINSALNGARISVWSCAECGSRVEYAYLEDCKFLNNYAEDAAGAITGHYYEIECQNCTFDSRPTITWLCRKCLYLW